MAISVNDPQGRALFQQAMQRGGVGMFGSPKPGMFQQGGTFGQGGAGTQGMLGMGLGMLQANAQGQGLGRSALAGLGSGLGSYMGAQQNIDAKGDRDKLMQMLMGRMGGVANKAGGPPPGAPTDGPNPNSVLGGMFPRQGGAIGGGGSIGGATGGGPRGLGMFPQGGAVGGMYPPRPGMGRTY